MQSIKVNESTIEKSRIIELLSPLTYRERQVKKYRLGLDYKEPLSPQEYKKLPEPFRTAKDYNKPHTEQESAEQFGISMRTVMEIDSCFLTKNSIDFIDYKVNVKNEYLEN